LDQQYSSDLRDKHDKVRAYIGEGEREVNRVTTLDHATFSIISSAYRTTGHDRTIDGIAVELGTAIARIDGLCWPRAGAIFPGEKGESRRTHLT
jgi:hypothetical protein